MSSAERMRAPTVSAGVMGTPTGQDPGNASKRRLEPLTSLLQHLSNQVHPPESSTQPPPGPAPDHLSLACSCPSAGLMLFPHPGKRPLPIFTYPSPHSSFKPACSTTCFRKPSQIPVLVIPLGFSTHSIPLVVSGFYWTRGSLANDLGLSLSFS